MVSEILASSVRTIATVAAMVTDSETEPTVRVASLRTMRFVSTRMSVFSKRWNPGCSMVRL